ncbi:MAG: NADH-quinone oxidoreductase subunit C [Elusimicrobia bacterium]|nr:NADH-quinone oxidoreductase subunit C [Elusimicrobiota bacterium]
MTQEDLLSKLAAKLPHLEKAAAPVKDYLTMRMGSADDLIPSAKVLKDDLGFDYLEMISATDWLGAVKPEGYIRNPNPNVFLAEGATPQSIPTATPGYNYRPMFGVLWLFGNIPERARLFLRLEIARENARVPSLTGLFKSADWQERELYDLMGIRFEGHPNLIKILTPEFTQGHPLRKDYVHIKDKYDE